MPIYEYRCTACGRQFEVMQKMSDKPLTKCEECSGKLEKLISRTAFQLSGGGWYKSGYTKSGGSSESKPAGESKPEKKAAGGGSCGSGCGCH